MSISKTNRILRVGTRRSALAKAQTNWVIGELASAHPTLRIEIVEIVTTGDKILDTPLSKVPGKGVFVKEIEDKLLADEIDLAVHSMKDLPTDFPPGLSLGAISARVDPRDVFISRHGCHLSELPAGSCVGTSSLRRQAQLQQYRSDLTIVDIRGNIDTRLRKSESEPYDGILLAAAGLLRMGWDDRIQEYLSCSVMVPAVGQGALGIETREDDRETRELLAPLRDEATAICVQAERVFLAGMGGGCQTPMAAFCRERHGEVVFNAFHVSENGRDAQKTEVAGKLDEASEIAAEVVKKFKQGAPK